MMTRTIMETELGDGRKAIVVEGDNTEKELYIEGVHGFAVSGNSAKFIMFSLDPFTNDPLVERRVVAARVVMPLQALWAIAGFLRDRVDQLEQAGLIAPAAPSSSSKEGGPSAKNPPKRKRSPV
jgi:hypothetical protein